MRTALTTSPFEAAEFIRTGGIVAFPTETVYGLGANVFDENAVAKIFEAKRRPADNPLIAHISALEQIAELTSEIGVNAHKLIAAFFPGALTIVLRKADSVPLLATAGLDTIGVRMPRHELAHDFLKACSLPVVAPSANLSGKPSPTTWQAVCEDLDGRIDCILQGESTEIGLESTVVDCSSDIPVLLRQGAVTLAQLRTVVPETIDNNGDAIILRSPGMRHKHYSPRAKVILVDPFTGVGFQSGSAYIGIKRATVAGHFDLVHICRSVNEYAHALFEFFRECDRRNIHTIYCEEVPENGIGAALMDRLRRAADG